MILERTSFVLEGRAGPQRDSSLRFPRYAMDSPTTLDLLQGGISPRHFVREKGSLPAKKSSARQAQAFGPQNCDLERCTTVFLVFLPRQMRVLGRKGSRAFLNTTKAFVIDEPQVLS
jgi:hypothetical protein